MGCKQRKNMAFSFRILEMTFGAFLVICLFFGMKNIETGLMPVVDNFEVNEVSEVEGGIEMYGTMTKIRDCRFREMMIYVKRDDEKYPVAADFEFLDPAKNLKTRAVMSQRWGPWRVFIPGEYLSADIKMFTRHRCHAFYDTTTELHEFGVDRSNDNILIQEQ